MCYANGLIGWFASLRLIKKMQCDFQEIFTNFDIFFRKTAVRQRMQTENAFPSSTFYMSIYGMQYFCRHRIIDRPELCCKWCFEAFSSICHPIYGEIYLLFFSATSVSHFLRVLVEKLLLLSLCRSFVLLSLPFLIGSRFLVSCLAWHCSLWLFYLYASCEPWLSHTKPYSFSHSLQIPIPLSTRTTAHLLSFYFLFSNCSLMYLWAWSIFSK